MAGVLYGISVGAGDGGQMTLQAVRCMRLCDVILLPAASKELCHAYQIAIRTCPEIERKEYRCYAFPMTRDKDFLSASWDEIYCDILQLLQSGRSAGFLVIGDISIYSTYSYIEARAKRDEIETVTINGVPSFCACAGRLQIPLVAEEEELHVIPGSSDLERALQLSGTKVFMKLGKRLEKLKDLLASLVQADTVEIYAVSYCGMENEQIFFNLEDIPEEAGYLTTVIVKQAKR